ncbi:MAG: hypothetical protein OEX07_06030, partial [Gammaproteobacteria bacterium]|nr:hypothetical protein [Gammaproteobacteria bacterium]
PINEAYKAKVKYASYYYHEDYNRINRNQLVPGGACLNKKLSKDCVMEKTDIRILAKASNGDYVMVDTKEYDANLANGNITVLDAVEALGRYIGNSEIKVYDWNGTDADGNLVAGGGVKGDELRTVAGLSGTFNGDDLDFPRVSLVKQDNSPGNDLTDCSIEFGSPCIQPLRGAEAAFDTLVKSKVPGYIKGTADAPAMSGSF